MKPTNTEQTPPALAVVPGSAIQLDDPPHTKDIEFCENRGCAFNANTGKCSSTFGQCYGYFPPNIPVSNAGANAET